jgi:hypothetical protein
MEQVAELKKVTTTNFNIKHTLCKKMIPFSSHLLYVAQTDISSIVMDNDSKILNYILKTKLKKLLVPNKTFFLIDRGTVNFS